MPLSDYEHWNEDAQMMWWHEEGKHPSEPSEPDDSDRDDIAIDHHKCPTCNTNWDCDDFWGGEGCKDCDPDNVAER